MCECYSHVMMIVPLLYLDNQLKLASPLAACACRNILESVSVQAPTSDGHCCWPSSTTSTQFDVDTSSINIYFSPYCNFHDSCPNYYLYYSSSSNCTSGSRPLDTWSNLLALYPSLFSPLFEKPPHRVLNEVTRNSNWMLIPTSTPGPTALHLLVRLTCPLKDVV